MPARNNDSLWSLRPDLCGHLPTCAMNQHIRFCTSRDGVRIAYATMGRGPVVVKAANWLSHLEYEMDSPILRPWLDALSKHHTLVRYDERGCGLSDREVPNLSLDVLVDDLEAVVDSLELERFPLIGLSQGGPVAIAYASRHPERVSRLVLYGTYARSWLTTPRRRAMADTLLTLTELGWGTTNPAYRQVFTTMLIPEARADELAALTELQRLSTSPETAARLLKMFYDLDVSHLAPRLTVPALVAHSRRDGAIPFDQGRELAALIPDARFLPLESSNHFLLERETAWHPFIEAVHDFLQPERRPAAFQALTPRQQDVLHLIARGLDNAHIAEKLFISPKTVRNHITAIFSKLDVHDRAQAIVQAREAGFGQSRLDEDGP